MRCCPRCGLIRPVPLVERPGLCRSKWVVRTALYHENRCIRTSRILDAHCDPDVLKVPRTMRSQDVLNRRSIGVQPRLYRQYSHAAPPFTPPFIPPLSPIISPSPARYAPKSQDLGRRQGQCLRPRPRAGRSPACARPTALGLLDLEEAVKLRELGWAGPILLLEGFFRPTDIDVIDRYSLTTARALRRAVAHARNGAPVQAGQHPAEDEHRHEPPRLTRRSSYRAAWERARACQGVGQITLMTHFSDADGERGIAYQLRSVRARRRRALPARAASPIRPPRCGIRPRISTGCGPASCCTARRRPA